MSVALIKLHLNGEELNLFVCLFVRGGEYAGGSSVPVVVISFSLTLTSRCKVLLLPNFIDLSY